MKKEHLASKLEYITHDVEQAMTAFITKGADGRDWHVMNPFSDIYRLVFRVINRGLGAFEVAEDDILLNKVLDIFEKFEHYNNPYRIIMPWLPLPDHFWRLYYTAKLFLILRGVAAGRKRHGITKPDTIQYLLDQGCSTQEVVTVSCSHSLACMKSY